MPAAVAQINFQRQFGGGEVYAGFVARALEALGRESLLFVHPEARFWHGLVPAGTRIVAASDYQDVARRLPPDAAVLSHAPAEGAKALRAGHRVACFAHMPPQGRKAASFAGFDRVLPVSGWVRQGLIEGGIVNVLEPLYGVADLDRLRGSASEPIRRASLYDWDRRKFRDRLLGATEPLWGACAPHPEFHRREGALTLAIVSRLTPIKQFPALFAKLAPHLARHPNLRLEVFGSGGYASVRDLRRALAPLGGRVGWWGHQRDVASIYRCVDYVLTGLPELEALGLNVIEAQACGTPVLAVDAPPFTETVIDGATGYLYRDPRQDEGADFARLLGRIADPAARPRPLDHPEHLAKFSFDAFRIRLANALERLCA